MFNFFRKKEKPVKEAEQLGSLEAENTNEKEAEQLGSSEAENTNEKEAEQLGGLEAENTNEKEAKQLGGSEAENAVEEIIEETKEEPQKNDFSFSFFHLKETIEKTGKTLVESFVANLSNEEKIDEDTLDEMEETLIKADLGVETSAYIIDNLRAQRDKITQSNLREFLKNQFMAILNQTPSDKIHLTPNQLNIFLVTGVNGAGKTTLIGKMAYKFKQEGKKVLIAAGDTFRAAAEEQLDIWSKRAGADIIRNDGADSASVVFDAIKQAKEKNYDILLIDTAGRLQNKFNLMEELGKIKKVIDNQAPENLAESMLVIDASTGQNALKQAEVFSQTVDLTSVGLTKLDGSSKGAIVVAIAKELKIPVKLVGVGEKLEDIREFSSAKFIEALF
ncbi:MAG: signal recognition particle-docking protein FtsY [Candidatus Gastranaerophilales bacterium]|nr:signal recognition particle-docking protein FtsY [Candidatus Gastranaerophilales bacterium]